MRVKEKEEKRKNANNKCVHFRNIGLSVFVASAVLAVSLDFLLTCGILLFIGIIIARQIKNLNDTELDKLDTLTPKIYKALKITTVVLTSITLIFNIINFSEVNQVYNQISKDKVLRFNSVAVKQVEIDIICITDTFQYVIGSLNQDDYEDKYYGIEDKVACFDIVNYIESEITNFNFINVIATCWRVSRHFKSTKNMLIITGLNYVLVIWFIVDSVVTIKNKKRH